MKLSIITVNWNVADLLAACLKSLPAACAEHWPDTEVIVVDNASTDGSVDILRRNFPLVNLIALLENTGFTRGNNIGIARSRGDYISLLNPDTVCHPGSIAALLDYMDAHPSTGIAGPHLLNPDGTTQPSRRRFPTLLTALVESTPLQPYFSDSSLLRRFYMLDRSDDEPQTVGWLSGAALLCRREALSQAGFFDPGFFMFSEEVDLCRRVNDAGWQVDYVPSALVTHYGGQSTGQDVPARHINFNTGKLRYFRLHEGPLVARFLRLYLLATYSAQLLSEAAKWLLGHKRALRASRVRLYTDVLSTVLRERRPTNSDRVLLITGEYPPARGGVGDYTCKLRLALEAQHVPVSILTTSRSEIEQSGTTAARRATRPTVRAVPSIVRRVTLRSTLRALSATHSHIAHIQYQTGAYDLRPTVNFLPFLLSLLRPSKAIVTFHDLRVPYLFPKAGHLRTGVVWFMARTASASIATNPEDEATLRSWGVRNVALVPIGSNIPRNPPPGYDRDHWRASHGIQPDTVLLSYFGFLNSTKGLDDLLRALKLLRETGDFRLLMVGGGLGSSDPTNRDTASALASLASDLGITGSLIWTGYLDPPGVSEALLSSDLAVLPYADGASFRRGSLLAVLEHGLPLVTTRPITTSRVLSHDWPRLVDSQNAVLVSPGDPREIAEAVRRVASDSPLQAALRSGAEDLAAYFSWERIARAHRNIYSSLFPSTPPLD